MFLVNRFAAAMDMTAAGTSAPIEIAAKAKPANQLGNSRLISAGTAPFAPINLDRKSTRLNSSHQIISYAVFCLKKKERDLINLERGLHVFVEPAVQSW